VEAPNKPLIEYPTVYAFKVMGRREPGFDELVRRLFAGVLGGELDPAAITENRSKEGNFVSLTVSVPLESEAQRQSIYAELHREKRVLYYL
jgi:uncharacterized protein